jgi:hypothetical protein
MHALEPTSAVVEALLDSGTREKLRRSPWKLMRLDWRTVTEVSIGLAVVDGANWHIAFRKIIGAAAKRTGLRCHCRGRARIGV